jgi:hypothetical protein
MPAVVRVTDPNLGMQVRSQYLNPNPRYQRDSDTSVPLKYSNVVALMTC